VNNVVHKGLLLLFLSLFADRVYRPLKGKPLLRPPLMPSLVILQTCEIAIRVVQKQLISRLYIEINRRRSLHLHERD
jgi:hypothetical protein